jgi:23S rRNA (guanine745-N1)-methyltransferase
MTQIPNNSLACPHDGLPLSVQDKCVVCPSGHSFDRAKRGYLNLLPVNQKRSKDPGDSQEMIAARNRFLERGYYLPLAQSLAENSRLNNAVSLLDAGCGEGYYLRQLEQQFPQTVWKGVGLDISKPAIDSAAKFDKGFQYLVASNAHIPLLDNSVDVVWCVFGFANFDEFRRVLTPGGRLIMADPGPEHLIELREIIYPHINDKHSARDIPAGFQHHSEQHLTGKMDLDASAIVDLLLMTPHLYRANPAGRAAAAALAQLVCRFDIHVRVFTKL